MDIREKKREKNSDENRQRVTGFALDTGPLGASATATWQDNKRRDAHHSVGQGLVLHGIVHPLFNLSEDLLLEGLRVSYRGIQERLQSPLSPVSFSIRTSDK